MSAASQPHDAIQGGLDGPERGWTENRVAFLKAAVAAGLSCSQAAQRLRISRNAAIGKAARLGFRFNSDGSVRSQPQEKDTVTPRRPAPPARVASLERVARSPAPAPRPVPASPKAAVEPQSGGGPRLADLKSGECRWPIGDVPRGQGDRQLFCGAAAASLYCAHHRKIAFNPRPAAGRRSETDLARGLRRYL